MVAAALQAGLLDEVILHQVPVLLSGGTPYFHGLASSVPLTLLEVVDAPGVTHLRFAVAWVTGNGRTWPGGQGDPGLRRHLRYWRGHRAALAGSRARVTFVGRREVLGEVTAGDLRRAGHQADFVAADMTVDVTIRVPSAGPLSCGWR